MDGKTLYVYLTLLVCLRLNQVSPRKAEMRGGLLFEKDSDTPALINPKFALYHRVVNLNTILQAAKMAQQFTEAYDSFCAEISTRAKNMFIEIPTFDMANKYVVINDIQPLIDAPKTCATYNYMVPEIRTFADLDQIRTLAKSYKITKAYAGVYYDDVSNTLKYRSNQSPITTIFETVAFTVNGLTVNNFISHKSTQQHFYSYPHLAYELHSRDFVAIQDKTFRAPTICQRVQILPYKQMHNNITLNAISHMCKRDQPRFRKQALQLIEEVKLFQYHPDSYMNDESFKPPITNLCEPLCTHCQALLQHMQHYTTQLARQYQIPPDITLKFLQYSLLNVTSRVTFRHFFLTNDWSKFSSDDNPFTGILLDLDCEITQTHVPISHSILLRDLYRANLTEFTESALKIISDDTLVRRKRAPIWMPISHIPEFYNVKAIAVENTKALQELNLHKDEIVHSHNALRKEIISLKNISSQQDYAFMALLAEKDTKDARSELQNVVQIALIQLSLAMTDALNHRTSPYVLSHNELKAIVIQESKNKLLLSSRLEDVLTTLHRNATDYYFQIAIPVIDDKAAFRLYQAKPIPIFGPNSAIISLTPDIEYIGISADTTKYLALSSREYEDCHKGHFCTVSGSPFSFNLQTSCTASSYRSNTLDCPKTQLQYANPFFVTYGNVTFYSVPTNYTIDTICPNTNSNFKKKPVRGLTILSGLGLVTINQNCFLKLPDDRIIEPHHQPDHSTDLGVSHITQALTYAPNLDTYSFNLTHNDQFWSNWTNVPELELPTWQNKAWNFVSTAFSPQNLATQSFYSVATIILIIVVLGILCCLFPSFYDWVKTVLLIRNPRKYWTTKGLFVPYWNKPGQPSHAPRDSKRAVPFTYWWRRVRTSDTDPTAPTQEEELHTMLRRNTNHIARPTSLPLFSTRRPKAPKQASQSATPQANVYLPADNHDTAVVHDTSNIPNENEWRANSHAAAQQLKALNAP